MPINHQGNQETILDMTTNPKYARQTTAPESRLNVTMLYTSQDFCLRKNLPDKCETYDDKETSYLCRMASCFEKNLELRKSQCNTLGVIRWPL